MSGSSFVVYLIGETAENIKSQTENVVICVAALWTVFFYCLFLEMEQMQLWAFLDSAGGPFENNHARYF